MSGFLRVGLTWLVCITILSGVGSKSFALEKFGIGVGIGDISGISFYGKIDSKHFGQGLLAFANELNSFAITADYGIAFPGAMKDLPIITPFYGFGGAIIRSPRYLYYHRLVVVEESTIGVGARLPLGVQLDIPETPIQLSLEIVPWIFVVPATFVELDALFAVRVVF